MPTAHKVNSSLFKDLLYFLRAEIWKIPNQRLCSQRTEMSKFLCQILLSSDARTLPHSQGIMNSLRRLAVSSHSSSPPTLLRSHWAISVSPCIIHSFNTPGSLTSIIFISTQCHHTHTSRPVAPNLFPLVYPF